MRTIRRQAFLPTLLALALTAIILGACGTLEVGIERTPTPAGVTQVKVFLVAMDDAGQTGPLIGCGDSIVAIERGVAPTQEPLRAAIEELLSIRERFYGQSGLYNALHQSDLEVESVSLVDGRATIQLRGRLTLGGTCDEPRIQAQLSQTALQFPLVNEVVVSVNGEPLDVSLK
jgi:hypothetical protein